MTYAEGFPKLRTLVLERWSPLNHGNHLSALARQVFGVQYVPRILEILRVPLGGYSLVPWEDAPGRTREEVATLVDRAYARIANPPKKNAVSGRLSRKSSPLMEAMWE